MTETTGWEALGELIESTRIKRFPRGAKAAYTKADLAAATWKRLEAGLPVKDATLYAVDDLFGWPTGRAKRIATGEEAVDGDSQQQTFREFVRRASLPESFRADVLRLLDAYEAESGVRAG